MNRSAVRRPEPSSGSPDFGLRIRFAVAGLAFVDRFLRAAVGRGHALTPVAGGQMKLCRATALRQRGGQRRLQGAVEQGVLRRRRGGPAGSARAWAGIEDDDRRSRLKQYAGPGRRSRNHGGSDRADGRGDSAGQDLAVCRPAPLDDDRIPFDRDRSLRLADPAGSSREQCNQCGCANSCRQAALKPRTRQLLAGPGREAECLDGKTVATGQDDLRKPQGQSAGLGDWPETSL